MIKVALIAMGILAAPGAQARASDIPALEIVIDADYSIAAEGAQAIEAGLNAGLAVVDYRLGGIPVKIVAVDHRGNVNRSHQTMKRYLNSDTALAIFGGVHSPPYLRHREWINENRVLTLLPWSAAGPITRPAQGDENWIFRLSVDDSKAGAFLIDHAVEHTGCRKPALILIDTAWGRSNRPVYEAELARHRITPAAIEMVHTAIGELSARDLAERIAEAGADCAIMLSNAVEGAFLTNALYEAAPDLVLLSHWGILSGDFFALVNPDVWHAPNLHILQTCGLRAEAAGNPLLEAALSGADFPTGPVERLSDVQGATGFVHGHDLMLLLASAAEQVSDDDAWRQGTIADRRALLRDALERLQNPVAGILKTYTRPFSPWSPDTPDAHEALGADGLCMTQFDPSGVLALLD